ncbi:hypothetical protein [Lactococcus phage D7138]
MAKIAVTKLKYVRLSKGETIEHMTEILEVSRNQYEKWEEGTSTPPKIKKEFLGEYFSTNHKKLFTKFWIERELIEELEKKLVLPINSKESESITVPFFKAERLKRGLTQGQLSDAIGVSIYFLRLLETGYRPISPDKKKSIIVALAKYFEISITKVCEPTVISIELEKSLQGKSIKLPASQKNNNTEQKPENQELFFKKVDEMSGQEVRELAKRIYSQNLRYEEENNKLKATIVEIQTNNSEETSYKQRFEELQESTKGAARVAELAKELFVELSVGSF